MKTTGTIEDGDGLWNVAQGLLALADFGLGRAVLGRAGGCAANGCIGHRHGGQGVLRRGLGGSRARRSALRPGACMQ